MSSNEELNIFSRLVLTSYYFETGVTRNNRNSDRTGSFMKGPPNIDDLPIFQEPSQLLQASLFLREHKKPIFDATPISEINKYIDIIFSNNIYEFISNRNHIENSGCYLDRFNFDDLADFTNSIGGQIFNGPPAETYSFPVSCLNVSTPYHGYNYYILEKEGIDYDRKNTWINKSIEHQAIDAWIGCSAPFKEAAEKHKRIVLASISLRLGRNERTQKTVARPPNGFFAHGMAGQLTWSTSTEHAPQLGYQINITAEDSWWLEKIDNLVSSNTKDDRRTRKALEYLYHGWFRTENERVPFNFMAIDALFGQGKGRTGEKILKGISSCLEQEIHSGRLGDILLLRNQFIHGGGPDIYDSSLYKCYIKAYGFDPIIDIDYLVASCLRKIVFGKKFSIQPNPYHEKIETLKTRGILSAESLNPPIITEI